MTKRGDLYHLSLVSVPTNHKVFADVIFCKMFGDKMSLLFGCGWRNCVLLTFKCLFCAMLLFLDLFKIHSLIRNSEVTLNVFFSFFFHR